MPINWMRKAANYGVILLADVQHTCPIRIDCWRYLPKGSRNQEFDDVINDLEVNHIIRKGAWYSGIPDMMQRLQVTRAATPTYSQFEYMVIQTKLAFPTFRFHLGRAQEIVWC